jgi:hypothetical protein
MFDAGGSESLRELVKVGFGGDGEREMVEAESRGIERGAVAGTVFDQSDTELTIREVHDARPANLALLPEALDESEHRRVPLDGRVAVGHGEGDVMESGEFSHRPIIASARTACPTAADSERDDGLADHGAVGHCLHRARQVIERLRMCERGQLPRGVQRDQRGLVIFVLGLGVAAGEHADQ